MFGTGIGTGIVPYPFRYPCFILLLQCQFIFLSVLALEMDFSPPDNPEMTARSPSALISAARAGDLDRVKELIAAGASVDAHDNDGFSALAIAALCGHEGVVRHLLDVRTNPSMIHADLLAVEWRFGWSKIDALLRVGRGINQPVLESMTPMEWAASKGNIRLKRSYFVKPPSMPIT